MTGPNQMSQAVCMCGLVTVGKGPADQTKTTNAIRSLSKDLGKGW